MLATEFSRQAIVGREIVLLEFVYGTNLCFVMLKEMLFGLSHDSLTTLL